MIKKNGVGEWSEFATEDVEHELDPPIIMVISNSK